MRTRSQQPDNFVLLDGFRGVGALLVVVGHSMPLWGPFWPQSGALVVDAFFLLSGFVIAYSCEPRLAGGQTPGAFMVQRIVRLYPLYLAGTLLGFAVFAFAAINDGDSAQGWLLTLRLIPQLLLMPAPEAFGATSLYPLNGPAWTLFFELTVYTVYALAFRWLTTPRLIMLVALCALALAATILAFGKIDVGSNWETWWGGFARAGFGFFAGVLTFRLAGSPRTARRRTSRRALPLLFGLPLVCLIPASPQLRPFLDMFLMICLGMPTLYFAQSIEPPRQFARIFLIGGRLSYAIYILHQPLWELALRASWQYGIVYDIAPLGGAVLLVLVAVFAWFVEKYYDRPVRRWLLRRLERQLADTSTPAQQLAA